LVKIGVRDAPLSPKCIDRIFITSKIALDGEIISERRCHGHNSVNYSGPSIDWGTTSLAVQFRLGILAKWRTGLNSFDYNHPRLDGAYLSESQDCVLMKGTWPNFATSITAFGSEIIQN
jgi:hypothetical protein